MSWAPGMTPRYVIRVWAALDRSMDDADRMLGLPRHCEPVAEIEVDQTGDDALDLTIYRHRGLQLMPQKMLTAGGRNR
jgi:hypothetical protein